MQDLRSLLVLLRVWSVNFPGFPSRVVFERFSNQVLVAVDLARCLAAARIMQRFQKTGRDQRQPREDNTVLMFSEERHERTIADNIRPSSENRPTMARSVRTVARDVSGRVRVRVVDIRDLWVSRAAEFTADKMQRRQLSILVQASRRRLRRRVNELIPGDSFTWGGANDLRRRVNKLISSVNFTSIGR